MEAWKRAGAPALAAILVLLGVLVIDWANVAHVHGLSARLAPWDSELCAGDGGAGYVPLGKTHGAWRLFARSVGVVGVLAAVALVILAVLRALVLDPAPLERARRWLCVSLVATTACAMVASGASVGELAAGGPITAIGGVVGLVSGAGGLGGAFGGGRSNRPLRSTATVVSVGPDPYREPGAVAAPAPIRRAAPSIVEPERDRRAPVAASPSKGAVQVAPAAPVAADATRGALRFVVAEGTLTATGLVVRLDRGEPRALRWSEIVEVAARRMPPDPPYEKTAFVDLVTAAGPPVRLLPTTRLDLAVLPGGIAPNTKENWRRLVAHARERNPNLALDAESAGFFAGDRDPPMFPALKEFVEWDRRYDGRSS